MIQAAGLSCGASSDDTSGAVPAVGSPACKRTWLTNCFLQELYSIFILSYHTKAILMYWYHQPASLTILTLPRPLGLYEITSWSNEKCQVVHHLQDSCPHDRLDLSCPALLLDHICPIAIPPCVPSTTSWSLQHDNHLASDAYNALKSSYFCTPDIFVYACMSCARPGS